MKFWREDTVRGIIERLAATFSSTGLDSFLGSDVLLVPAPRSAPLLPGALWPPRRICDELLRAGLGNDVVPALVRTQPVRKAAYAGPGNRPTVQEHYETMAVEAELVASRRITIVDDFITKGSTLLAAASRLSEAYRRSEVKAFALVRTMGLVREIEAIIDPTTGTITPYFGEGDRQP